MLSEHIEQLHTVAKALMEHEKLTGEAFRTLMEGGTLPGDEEPVQAVSTEADGGEIA